MQAHSVRKPILTVCVLWIICFILRMAEYLLLRTDQTILGEAFVHKLLGIFVMYLAARHWHLSPAQLGFPKKKMVSGFAKGFLFGIFVFAIAYGAEIAILMSHRNFSGLEIYVSAYAVDGNIGNQTGLLFFALCILGNLINVLMEEGIFRGLFPAILEKKYSHLVSAIIASLLFGIWHIMAPFRSFLDGNVSLLGFLASSLMLIVTSAIIGFKFAMMTKLTGSLYLSMGDHFVNNTIVNILHVVSTTGADEGMSLRVAIAQSVSFLTVLAVYLIRNQKENKSADR